MPSYEYPYYSTEELLSEKQRLEDEIVAFENIIAEKEAVKSEFISRRTSVEKDHIIYLKVELSKAMKELNRREI